MRRSQRSLVSSGVTGLGLIVLIAITGCAGPGWPLPTSSQKDPYATTLEAAASESTNIGDFGGETNEGVLLFFNVKNRSGDVASCLDYARCGTGVEFGTITATLHGVSGAVYVKRIYSNGTASIGINFGAAGVPDYAPIAADYLQKGSTAFTLPHNLPGGTPLTFDVEFTPADGNPYLGSSATLNFDVPIVALSIADVDTYTEIAHGESTLFVDASLSPMIEDDMWCPLGTWHFSVSDENGALVAEDDQASNGETPKAEAAFAALPAGTYSVGVSFEPADDEFGRYIAANTASIPVTVGE
jgi:hypothetical protein